MNTIQSSFNNYIPMKAKASPKGWRSFNAVCCQHNGETQDRRGRGGLNLDGESVAYSCFNCGFSVSWHPGQHFSGKMRKLAKWMGMPDEEIRNLVLSALKEEHSNESESHTTNTEIKFDQKPLPPNTHNIYDLLLDGNEDPDLLDTATYILNRGYSIDDYNWCWSSDEDMKKRLIIPFYRHGKIIGYTARSIKINSLVKYLNVVDSNYVFNLDNQHTGRDYAILVEGPLDAIACDGIAVMNNKVSQLQAQQINELGKKIIVVPDRDISSKHPGRKLVDAALSYGWSVSFPEWENGIKDVSDSYKNYGALYTLRTIFNNIESSELKIKLLRGEYGV